jgi:tubulin--tyrosine ligase
MESPLLINVRKFDIRVWVLITMEGKVYFFKEGYLRMTSSNYDLNPESICRPEVHLTNNAVQSKCEDYGKFESGN